MASGFAREGGYGRYGLRRPITILLIPIASSFRTRNCCFRRISAVGTRSYSDQRRWSALHYSWLFRERESTDPRCAEWREPAARLVDLRVGSPIPRRMAIMRSRPSRSMLSEGCKKSTGNVIVLRNGVAVTLKVGDAMFKGDVVETGIDGLSHHCRSWMERHFIFPPAGTWCWTSCLRHGETSNSACFSRKRVVRFIAGKVATTGRLVIDTPSVANSMHHSGGGLWEPGLQHFHLWSDSRIKSCERRHRSA